MYPDYECNNNPMSITDEDGPFLVMEAELFYNDELNDEFKKSRARHYYSCASAATALYYCKSLAEDDDNPWYVSWEKAVEQYPLEKCESATMLYWVEPTDPLTALDARYPQYDLEPYVSKAMVPSRFFRKLIEAASAPPCSSPPPSCSARPSPPASTCPGTSSCPIRAPRCTSASPSPASGPSCRPGRSLRLSSSA